MTNEFQTQLSLLIQLQDIDLKISKIDRKIKELPEDFAQIESEYLSIKNEYDEFTNELKEAELQRRIEETELKSTQEELVQRESKLYAIKTNKEYQAVLKEIAEAKRANKEREEIILELMEKIDELNEKNTQLKSQFADKEVVYNNEKQKAEADEKEFSRQIQELKAKRPDLEQKIDKIILRKYDTVRQRHDNTLVTVENGVCNGCNMNIPPQLFNEMLKLLDLKICPNCHRLIYYIKKEEEEKE